MQWNPDELTRHHIIAKERGWTFDHKNIVLLTRKTHDCVHALLWNDLPFEVLRWILDKYKTSIDSDAYQLVNWVLRKVEWTIDAYNPDCFDRYKLSHYFKKNAR